MPNWCMNELTVRGPVHALDQFRAAAVGKNDEGEELPLDFEKLYPTPSEKELKVLPFSEFFSFPPFRSEKDWYHWRLRHWGTKWAPSYVELKAKPKRLFYSFDTANSPPAGLLKVLSGKYPELVFQLRYGEGGNDFQGMERWQAGRRLHHEEGSFVPKDWGQEEDEQ